MAIIKKSIPLAQYIQFVEAFKESNTKYLIDTWLPDPSVGCKIARVLIPRVDSTRDILWKRYTGERLDQAIQLGEPSAYPLAIVGRSHLIVQEFSISTPLTHVQILEECEETVK